MDVAQREIMRLWGSGRNTAQIAKEIKWSEPAVDNEVHKIIQYRYLEREGRKCLVCRKMFVSEGNGNRTCQPCKTYRKKLERLNRQRAEEREYKRRIREDFLR